MVVGTIKTLIIGAEGMLGADLCKIFPDALKLTRQDLDVTDEKQVNYLIKKLKPNIVINAAAYTDVDGCEDNIELAFEVNGYGPGYIAEACSEVRAQLIHFSTDYVFDGSKREYAESARTNPINVYGESKLLGEQKIIQALDNYKIIRTSWLFGVNGGNFVNTMLSLSSQVESVKVVNDQYGKPTYTKDLAYKTSEIIDLESGIYHITNEGTCTWYEFASAIIENVEPCSSSEYQRKANRPKYSVLTNTKTEPLRHWKYALNDYLTERKGELI